MRKKWNRKGFTMAELLIVVAIIVVLAAVAFIALQTHQKNLEMAERDSIAKEIYFAAQNHLIMAESQGYPGLTGEADFGTALADTSGTRGDVKGVYYTTTHDRKGIMDLMLPFGSIDEIVRCGSYIIHYQKEPARVLDVFYWEEGDSQSYDDLMGIRENRNARRDRKPMTGWYGGTGTVETGVVLNAPTVVIDNGARLTVTVTDPNPDNRITQPDGTVTPLNTVLELIISGETVDGKTAKCVILLKDPGTPLSSNDRIQEKDGTYTIVLDDITTPKPATTNGDGLHFADLNAYADSTDNRIWFMADPETGDKIEFKPGENITVEAVAFSNDALASIAYSGGQTTNSLFGDVDTGEETIGKDGTVQKGTEPPTALVGNFRHLENLDATVSGLDKTLNIRNARQTEDLVWADATNKTGFVDEIRTAKSESGAVQVYKLNAGSTDGSGNDSYLPVTLDYALTYEAAYTEGEGEAAIKKCHSITGLTVGTAETPYSGDAGVFNTSNTSNTSSASTASLNVSNLALVDFDIHATGNAGALAGSLPVGGSVKNVVAYNSDAFDAAKSGAATIASTGTGSARGSAGGLVGTMTNVHVERCAAALVVSSEGKDAGGLLGETHGSGGVKDSYSGGHVEAVDGAIGYSSTKPNVSAPSGYAGGLIGNAEAKIENCYSTCSASGSTAGGLVGKAGTDVKNSYCTGLVQGASATSEVGAFAGQLVVSPTNCHYYEIMNPVTDDSGVITYLAPVSGKTLEDYGEDKLQPLDATATGYDAFVGAPASWAAAQPYCDDLADYYARTTGEGDDAQTSAVYPLRPLSGVSATATGDAPADFVATHYGDWPMPETLVVNTR